MRWDIITGEYPPQPGGVSDHTRQIAAGFAAAGDDVHVWAPSCSGSNLPEPGVTVHRIAGGFGARGLKVLAKSIPSAPAARVLVQYVPQAFGYKGLNLPFCMWLLALSQRHAIRTLFHEVSIPFQRGRGWRWNAGAVLTWIMAAAVAQASERIYISVPAWDARLRGLTRCKPSWLPVPSNLPIDPPREQAVAVRGSLALEKDSVLLGHFSTYNLDVSRALCRWLPALLNDDRARVALLIGHRSSRYAADLAREHPALSDRLRVAEALDPEQVAAHVSVCDLMIQPYPDGISSRRTTVMSALALGLPILTNAGRSTEPLWAESGAVIVVGGDDTTAVSAAGNRILRDPELRATLKSRASALYRERFAVERTVDRLRNDATEVN